jgi:hypothetical protein
MNAIPLRKGGFSLVDDEDYAELSQYTWCIDAYGYAVANTQMIKGEFTSLRLHRVVMNAPTGLEVDHINGNRLDNRKQNLRLCTKAENGRNRPANRNNTSGYKGVTFKKGNTKKPWCAQIKVNKKRIYLGSFETPQAAYEKYKSAALIYHKEFANVG